MHIRDIFARDNTTFSFEFFPPKNSGDAEELFRNIAQLEELSPSFVSVTYGAGGSTRELTRVLVVRIRQTTQIEAVPHLTCVCHTEAEIE
ncbi:MAG: methylenetetrahydrofolate reductase, partial [Acidobacteria bacterium]|nr:methylenetetrahydrofolate reductase [Acidobacteriota bacterium]